MAGNNIFTNKMQTTNKINIRIRIEGNHFMKLMMNGIQIQVLHDSLEFAEVQYIHALRHELGTNVTSRERESASGSE